jgi:AcrR family transcriptional regulator
LPNRRTYRSPQRKAASEATRERIVRAASALLHSTNGVRRFSLASVGTAAGVTRLTVYNQFGSRRALLEAVFDAHAARGGLHRLADAMGDPDPSRALARLVSIFCDFWSYDSDAMAWLHGNSGVDAEFAESMRARQERRRHAVSVLVARMGERGLVAESHQGDLIDILHTLTSFPVFASLTAGGRNRDATCGLIQNMVDDAVRRATGPAAPTLR